MTPEQSTAREEVVEELHQVGKDLEAFLKAKAVIQQRINEMEGTARQETFVSWAMTQVLLNSFILATVRCEGMIQDLRKVLETLDTPDNVVPFSCVKGDQHDPSGQ